MTLLLKIKIYNKEENYEIILINDKQNQDLNIIDNNDIYKELRHDIQHIKNKIIILKDEIEKLKILYNHEVSKIKQFKIKSNNIIKNINNNNNSEPKDIQFLKEITKDSYAGYDLLNSFNIFKSIDDILYLIYANKNKSIISYNIFDNKKLNEIRNAHDNYISNFRHYIDKINKRSLVLSLSAIDNNIKLWNINNLECLLNIKNVNEDGFLYSACILNNNNEIYIVTSNENLFNTESIKVFNLHGKKIKEISNSKDSTLFMDIYYNNILSKNYIITGNNGYIKSYDYDQDKIYHKYCDEITDNYHKTFVINIVEETIKLVESSYDGYIRIWDFSSGILLNKIKVTNSAIFGTCLWNNKYLLIGSEDKTIKLIELKNGKIIKNLIGHINKVISIKKIIHPTYGDILISQGWQNDQIKLWINKY